MDLLPKCSHQKTVSRSWSDAIPRPKPEIRCKIMLCVWWDQKGIIYYEFLEFKQTVNANLYSNQLTRLSRALEVKRPYKHKGSRKIILLHDIARSHVAKTTRQTTENLCWEVLNHPAYSPNLAPSHYYLFRLVQHFLSGKNFQDIESVRKEVAQYFDSKPANSSKEFNHCQKDGRRLLMLNVLYFIINKILKKNETTLFTT